jgi:hypothetical protein
MAQDDWQIVASHLAILKADGCRCFLTRRAGRDDHPHAERCGRPGADRGQDQFRELPTLNVLKLPMMKRGEPPAWMTTPPSDFRLILHQRNYGYAARSDARMPAVNLALSMPIISIDTQRDATSLISCSAGRQSVGDVRAWVSGWQLYC